MHTFQMNSHISENGVLSVTLPKEWAKQDVNVLLVLEPLTQPVLTQSQQHLKEALNKAVALNVFEGIDGVEWQKEQRQDSNDVKTLLTSVMEGLEDSDFERPRDFGREQPEWDF